MTRLNSTKFDLITDTSRENIFNYTHIKPLTRILNALSMTFCVGERFFCDAVRFHSEFQDDEIVLEIKEFIKQEGQHSMAHRSLNNILQTSYGVDVKSCEKSATQKLNDLGITPQKKLLTTVCLEELTAFGGWLYILGGKIAFKRGLQTTNLWHNHAKEEVDHHFVARTVYKKVYGKNKLKFLLHFAKTSAKLFSQVVENYRILKQAEKEN